LGGYVVDFPDGRPCFLAAGTSGRSAVKPSPVVEDLVRPVLRVGMPCAPRQGPAGRGQGAENSWQVAAGSWQHAEGTAEPSNRRTAVPLNCRTVEPSYCRTAVEHERNDRFRQRTTRDKTGRVLQTERRSPGRCPRSPLDHSARRGQPSLHGALRPPAGPPKK